MHPRHTIRPGQPGFLVQIRTYRKRRGSDRGPHTGKIGTISRVDATGAVTELTNIRDANGHTVESKLRAFRVGTHNAVPPAARLNRFGDTFFPDHDA